MSTSRRSSLIALLGFVTAGCGGGGGSGTAQSMSGTLQTRAISSQANNTTYPLSIYLPADSEAIRATLPTVYLLDGESRFQAVVDIVEARQLKVLVVGIGNEALRAHDYVPANPLHARRRRTSPVPGVPPGRLIPFIEANVGGDPQRRLLLGHSHGGSFVLYALFNEGPAGRRFSAYLASDASIDCMSATVYGWETAYADVNIALPVRLHISYAANTANLAFAQQIQSRRYSGLALVAQFYGGGHIGMIPLAFADALALALS